MGYYLTTEPDKTPLANSLATPKTHVPGPPVKERGYRYYQPECGRWVNRDPLQEAGGINLYEFSVNDGVDNIDPFGLSFCSWLQGKIRSYLTTTEEKRAWDRFVSGTKKDIILTNSEMQDIVTHSSKFTQKVNDRKLACDVATYPQWFGVIDSVGDSTAAPWTGAIGGVSIKLTSTCACRCLYWSAKIDDLYDFDPLWFKTHRSPSAEIATILVNFAQHMTTCGWGEFHHKGETSGSCGWGCHPPP